MKTNIKAAAAFAANLLYPRVCPVCGEVLGREAKEWNDPFICPECLDELNFLSGRCRCMRCSRPVEDGESEYCDECRARTRYFDTGFALLAHDDSARKIIYDLKFRSLKDNADMLALELAFRAGKMAELWGAQALIPVPLHKKRLKQRGFNQAQILAEKFSEYAQREGCNIPPADSTYLLRSEGTKPQMNTDYEQRAENVRGAFMVNAPNGPYKSVILMDDIYTTGATLNECAKTLKQNGTSMVYFLACSIVS